MTGNEPYLMVDINAMGDTKIEAFNCTGEQCVQESQPLEVVLGGVEPGKRDPKPEFYAPNSAANAIKSQF